MKVQLTWMPKSNQWSSFHESSYHLCDDLFILSLPILTYPNLSFTYPYIQISSRVSIWVWQDIFQKISTIIHDIHAFYPFLSLLSSLLFVHNYLFISKFIPSCYACCLSRFIISYPCCYPCLPICICTVYPCLSILIPFVHPNSTPSYPCWLSMIILWYQRLSFVFLLSYPCSVPIHNLSYPPWYLIRVFWLACSANSPAHQVNQLKCTVYFSDPRYSSCCRCRHSSTGQPLLWARRPPLVQVRNSGTGSRWRRLRRLRQRRLSPLLLRRAPSAGGRRSGTSSRLRWRCWVPTTSGPRPLALAGLEPRCRCHGAVILAPVGGSSGGG